MSESGDFTPASWGSSDFKSARRAYDAHASRSYDSAKPKDAALVPKVSTDAKMPLVIMCDMTGSMDEWPAVIFSKMPYLANEAGVYLGKDHAIAVGAIGDARMNDPQPLQMRPFGKDKEVQERLLELLRQGGGSNQVESYELGLLYCLKNVEMPKATHPILIVISDEGVYDSISKAHAAEYGIEIDKEMRIEEIAEELKEKFGAVYILRKPYGDQRENGDIHARWAGMFGSDKVIDLQDPQRAVDVIFGVLAKETGKIDYFRDELEERQKPDQVKTVYKALETVHGTPATAAGPKGKTKKGLLPTGKSTLHKPGTSKRKSKSLLDDDEDK